MMTKKELEFELEYVKARLETLESEIDSLIEELAKVRKSNGKGCELT